MDALQSAIAQYIFCANEVVQFKMVRNVEDLASEDGYFNPDMSHQIFGEKEQIFGFKKLRINLFYAASTLHIYVNIKYEKKLNPKYAEGVEPDNIMEKLKDVLPLKFSENIDEFSSQLETQASFHPHGELINTYTRQGKETSLKRTFQVYKADVTCPGFKDYHQRMESFILWFIDAASYIDADDDKWDFYTVFEKIVKSGITTFNFVGYSTCYRFYAYPDRCRPRISQVLVLPVYQKQGHCTALLSTIYQQYTNNSSVVDITAEDPSDNFQRVRDFVDAKNLAQLKAFCPANLKESYSKEMEKSAKENHKINKRQARRIYEILRLSHTNEHDDDEFTKYRLSVKERINRPFKNESMRKKSRLLHDQLVPQAEERRLILQKEFEKCLEEYRKVVSRLQAC
uniref:Histone acetyltransferase type B catalytic subunit n=1 Tax=Phallusia mammillata TaxID=59560 RepID=A0A6F9DDN0_9ASCI|nr:histone acetyltransferase type B catalytic subunit [Phallusia mammillata]